MKKTLTAITAATALAAALTIAPADVYAGGRGGAVAAGLIGGLAAGAIIGGALAGPPVYGAPAYVGPGPGPYGAYAPVAGYGPYAGYAAPYPVACPGGFWARRPLYGPYGEFVGYSRPRFVCP
jgi:hypothetical protein